MFNAAAALGSFVPGKERIDHRAKTVKAYLIEDVRWTGEGSATYSLGRMDQNLSLSAHPESQHCASKAKPGEAPQMTACGTKIG